MAAVNNSDVICQVGQRIAIRRYREEDAASLSHHGSNSNVWNQMSDRMPHPYTVENANEWILRTRETSTQVAAGPSLEDPSAARIPAAYAITVDGEACGTVGLEFNTGVYRLNATLGYWLGEAYQGQGVMSRAIPAFVQWTWKTFGYLNRLNATAFESNTRSQKILQKCGFVLESTRINALIKNGKVCNEVTLGALRPNGT